MKKVTTIAFLIMLASNFVLAQVEEAMKEMSLGYRMSFTVELPDTDEKVATTVWKDFVKDFYGAKTKWNRKTKEYVSADVDDRTLDEGHGVTFYAKVDERKGDSFLTLWIDQGSAFASSENGGDKEAEKLLLKYALKVARKNIQISLENEEDVLKKLESQKKKLISAEKKYQKEIERAQAHLKENEQEQEKINKAIEEQLKKVEDIKNKLSDL